MYSTGHSLSAIANSLNVSKGRVRNALSRLNMTLRAHSAGQSNLSDPPSLVPLAIRTAPYGYCLLKGRLLEDPREMAVVEDILKWWKEGLSHGAIARRLNDQNIKPRKAEKWSQPTIGFILKRHTLKT